MSRLHHVRVGPIPRWVDAQNLLGEGDWHGDDDGMWEAPLPREEAADVQARLRGTGLGGSALEVSVAPRLKRPVVRDARTRDARRRRDTTPGFTRPGVRLDEEGRWSLTPEALALDVGRQLAASLPPEATVLDAGCGAGGNTIGLARAGLRVVAVDRDPQRVACARHNVGVYGMADRVDLSVGEAMDALQTASADAVFLDPPWGTVDRKACGLVDLGPLGTWLEAAAARSLPAWVKVPPSFDPRTVPGARATAWFGRARGDRHRVKFILLDVQPD